MHCQWEKAAPHGNLQEEDGNQRQVTPRRHCSSEREGMDNEVMDLWLNRCYVKRPGGFFRQKKSLLVLDSMRAHISDVTKERIRATDSIPAVIPGGLTKLLQPLDISVNRCFKAELRHIWEDWMNNGDKSFTATGCMRRASYPTVVQWVKDAWNAVPETAIIIVHQGQLRRRATTR